MFDLYHEPERHASGSGVMIIKNRGTGRSKTINLEKPDFLPRQDLRLLANLFSAANLKFVNSINQTKRGVKRRPSNYFVDTSDKSPNLFRQFLILLIWFYSADKSSLPDHRLSIVFQKLLGGLRHQHKYRPKRRRR